MPNKRPPSRPRLRKRLPSRHPRNRQRNKHLPNKRQPSRHLSKKPRQNGPLRMLHNQRPRLLPANNRQNSLHRTRPRRKPLKRASSPPNPANSLHSLVSSPHSKVRLQPTRMQLRSWTARRRRLPPSRAQNPVSNRLRPANSPHHQANSLRSRASRPRSRAPVDQGPPPESDAAAQAAPIAPEQIQPVIAEEGQRIDVGNTREERLRFRQERRERRQDAEVIEEFNDNRTIIQINNQTYIDSPDYDRIIHDRDDVYYEELPRGRIREVVTRPNGVRIVTVRNRYGDIIRRSRIEPDNREVILVYVEDRYYQDEGSWRDPGLDLPPMRLTIPREEYILDADYVEDDELYYEFLEQPPVERVERTYSLTEVKRSARIRDKVRRIDMDTLTFEFGSASIPESEIPKLEGVANAMQKLLEKNPAETFLLEGHTDAVGSDLANLALSDKRAELVAEALTNVFGIPPENLATQGYGEQYLKVNTEQRERENRRVAIRRVTPLVAPVASAN